MVVARRPFTRRRSKTAFVLSGGGNLGALQVGMLRALDEFGVVPDVVLGCSVGALNGAAYALRPDTAGVDELVRFWTATTSDEVMPSSRLPSMVQLLRRGESLHPSDGLRRGVESLLGASRRFDELVLPFQCVAAEVETAAETWFEHGAVVPAILASAALPAVYPSVTIDGRVYLDGGVVNNVPITRAIELGCSEIIVLHVGLHGRPDAQIRRPLDAAMQAYWVARNARFANDLATLPDGVEVLILPPGQRPDIRYDDFTQGADLIDRGHRNAVEFLERRQTELDERAGGERSGRLDRLRERARSTSWFQAARRAASDPEGAVLGPYDEEH